MRTITKEEIERFWTDGVVHLPSLLDENELTWLDEGLNESLEILPSTSAFYDLTAVGDTFAKQGATLFRDSTIDTTTNRGHFTVAVGLWMLVPTIRRVVFDSCLPQVASALLKSRKVNLYDDQVLIKPPRTADHTAFHEDQAYFHIDGNKACVMWVSPDLITPEMGPMQYVRGSHLWGPTYKPNLFVTRSYFGEAEGVELPDIESQREQYDIVTYATRPGDIIVHHYKTLHGSGGNASTKRLRRALSVRYCGDDVTYRFRPSAPPQPHHRHTLRDDDPVDSEQFPVVWQER
jgi:hypothetical protein